MRYITIACLLAVAALVAYLASAQTQSCNDPRSVAYTTSYSGTPIRGAFKFDGSGTWGSTGAPKYYCFEVDGNSVGTYSSSHSFPGTSGIEVNKTNPDYQAILASGAHTMKVYLGDVPFTAQPGDACVSGSFTPSTQSWTFTNMQLDLIYSKS
jgi:hypothetical protein